MALKTKKGLAYVLGHADECTNHILPMNAMQYSSHSEQLFTGGRDGTIKIWEAKKDERIQSPEFEFSRTFDKKERDNQEDYNEKLLKLEMSISSNPLNAYSNRRSGYSVVDTFDLHFDWINDLKLVNKNQSLVSCSSDLSLKLVDLNQNLSLEDQVPNSRIHKFANVHTDYVKQLSYHHLDNLIFSGGLDGKAVEWDLNTLKPIQEIQNCSDSTSLPCSIYSIANNDSFMIATGGPNNGINLYDRRSGSGSNLIKKLVGHQDNIRCLLMNSRFVLSGSSDSTIKLWDLRNFKVYKQFDIHDDAVWSLATSASSNPALHDTSSSTDFRVFYSGDRSGRVVKTDLSHLSIQEPSSDFDDFETFTTNERLLIDENLGISTIIAQADFPITTLCVEDNDRSGHPSSLFASTYTSLNRYYIPDTDQLSRYQQLRTSLDYYYSHENQITDQIGMIDGTGDQNDLDSDFYDLVSHLSMDSNALDAQSLFSGNYPISVHNIEGPNQTDIPSEGEYKSMFLNVNGGPSQEFINISKSAENKNNLSEVNDIAVEILLNPILSDQINFIPFNIRPFERFDIEPKSIISKKLFNNKRNILVLYLNGAIKIWDIFMCKEVKTFPYNDGKQMELTKELIEKRIKDMDEIFQKHQTSDTLNDWCDIEIKAGKLMVILKETSFTNVEVYYDELINHYPFLVYTSPENKNPWKKKTLVQEDDKFLLSAILLNSLFQQYLKYERQFDSDLRNEMQSHKLVKATSLSSFAESTALNSTDNQSSSLKMLKPFGKRASIINDSSKDSPSGSVIGGLEDNHSTYNSAQLDNAKSEMNSTDDASSTSNLDDSILTLLQRNKKKYQEESAKGKTIESMLKIHGRDPIPLSNNSFQYAPIIGTDRLPRSLHIIIFEYSPSLGNLRDVSAFKLDDINKIEYTPNKVDSLVTDLRCFLPLWLGKPLFYNTYPIKEPPKISFKLLECDYTKLDLEKKIGGKVQKKIKKLPTLEGSIKLTSHNMLRVSKILAYVVSKFDSKTPEIKDKIPPTEWLVLECKGVVLANNMTLQTIKTKIWKSSSDIELRFRRKFD